MRKTLLLLIVFFNVLLGFGQSNKIQFEYNKQIFSGKLKTSLNNLQEYIVVKNDNNEDLNFNIAQIKDIVINQESFVAAKVLNDATLTKNIAFLDHLSEPNYKENWVLLKVLVKGDYNLYQYSSSNFNQFYYEVKSANEIKPLVYKEYTTGSSVKKNNHFRSQLRKDVPLYFYVFNDYEKLEYKYDDLVKYFNKLNGYEENEGVKKINIKLSVFGGLANNFHKELYFADTAINSLYLNDYELEEKSPLFFGVSGEAFLDKNDLNAIFIDLGFMNYNTSYYLDYYNPVASNIKFEYKSNIMMINFGYKRYFNISSNSKIYASASLAPNFFFTSKNQVSYDFFDSGYDGLGNYYERTYNLLVKAHKNSSNLGVRFSMGYKFKNHYFAEVNYRKGANSEYVNFSHEITSFVLGYTF